MWWLRSPGYNQGCAAGVYSAGGVSDVGDSIGRDSYVLRPALWINLEP